MKQNPKKHYWFADLRCTIVATTKQRAEDMAERLRDNYKPKPRR